MKSPPQAERLSSADAPSSPIQSPSPKSSAASRDGFFTPNDASKAAAPSGSMGGSVPPPLGERTAPRVPRVPAVISQARIIVERPEVTREA
jgi:hypothetical protein